MKTLADIGDLKGKKILVRTDFDVPVTPEGKIGEEFRILRQKPLIDELVAHGARVLLVAHASELPSFEPTLSELGGLLGVNIRLCKNISEVASFWNETEPIALLENVRSFPGEEANDVAFAAQLVVGCDAYINNAFAVSHRAHASVARIPELVPSYAGPLLVEEIEQLASVEDAPREGKVIFMGGAKTGTKIPVIKNLIDNADAVVVGGVLANGILRELGVDVGTSRVDDNIHELIDGLDIHHPRLVFPKDFTVDSGANLDIGPQSAAEFAKLTYTAKLIVWNGPFGLFEDSRFMHGTETIARAIAASGARTIIGGGDTIAAVHQLGLLDSFTFVSTGGGAMLALLSGEHLPGLTALGYYHE